MLVASKFNLVTEAAGLQLALDELKGSEAIAIDTETAFPRDPVKAAAFNNPYNKTKSGDYGPFDPHTSEVRLVQLRGENTKPTVIDLWALGPDELKTLATFLEGYSGTYLLANAKFDLKHVFANLGVWLDAGAKIFDVIQASIMLGNSVGMGQVRGHKLKDLSRELLGLDLDKTDQASDWSLSPLSPSQLEYAAADVEHLHTLRDKLTKALVDMGQTQPLDLEMRVIGPVARMEYIGVAFDPAVYQKVQEAARVNLPRLLSKVARAFKDKLGAKILRARERFVLMDGTEYFETVEQPYWGGKAGKSLMQARDKVLAILNDLGLTTDDGEPIENTRRGDLEAYISEYPEVGLLLEYWALSKQAQFDYDKWVHPITKRIHSTLNISHAGTGRFSSTKPNGQQIPVKAVLIHPDGSVMNYRLAFRTNVPGRLIFSADWSGQELNVMAFVSMCAKFIAALCTPGVDLHSEIAAGLYGIDPSQARSKIPNSISGGTYRDRAKVYCYSLVYGKTDEGFASMWKTTVDEIKKMKEGFRGRFPGLMSWLENTGEEANIQQFTTLDTGAVRFVGGEGEGRGAQNARRRQGSNTAVQGLAAVMGKTAIVEFDRRVRAEGLGIWPCLPVHDEIVGEVEYDLACPCGCYWAGDDAKGSELKAAVAAAKKAKDDVKAKEASAALGAYEEALVARCEAECAGRHCAHRYKVIIGEIMTWAGDEITKGVVPTGHSCEIAKHWEH